MAKRQTKSEGQGELDLARMSAKLASDKKAENIVVLDMREHANFCDYFVICSATGSRHVRAVADGVEDGLREFGIKIRLSQGVAQAGRSRLFSYGIQPEAGVAGVAGNEDHRGHWALLDMGDVVVHVFEAGSREFYGLEHLWQGAPKIDW